MGGYPVVIVGYEVDLNKVTAYMKSHELGVAGLATRDSIRSLLMHFDKETSTSVTLARLEDSRADSRYFLCCYANNQQGWIQHSAGLEAVRLPQKFTSVVQALSRDANATKACAASGQLYSFDASGKSRF